MKAFYTPACVNGDAYTLSGNEIISNEAKERSVYYLANRLSPSKAWPEVAKDDRMLMWGISHYIMENLAKPITYTDILETKAFMDQAHFGNGPMPFDYKMWKRVVDEYGGYLPIVIEALPEGSVFYPHQPMVQVTSLDSGFGEIAAHIEATLVPTVALGTARATLTAHLYSWLMDLGKEYGLINKNAWKDETIDNFIHDFGMRAGIKEESMLYGLAHLLFFNGTDTFHAAFKAYQDGVTTAGKSIMALAHRVVQGFEKEEDCYTNLYNKASIGSYVADCYDFKRAVFNYLVPLAKQKKNIVVARPDSGDALENDQFVRLQAYDNALYNLSNDGKFIEPTYLCSIEGNSVKPDVMKTIMNDRYKNGFNPFKWGIFGIGGYLRNSITRDSLSTGYKLNAVGYDNRPVMKFSETEAKESLPGPLMMYNGRCSRKTNGLAMFPNAYEKLPNIQQQLIVYYNGGKVSNFVGDFQQVHRNAKTNFMNADKFKSHEVIVSKLSDTVDMLKKKYNKE